MTGRLFGTDGIRGVANEPPLRPDLVFRLGRAAAIHLAASAGGTGPRPTVLVGRDTRVSGPLLEQALVAGILSTGVDALVAGVLPTPAVAALTPVYGAVGGVVLSASHNPFEDNGIKLFGADGTKLSDAVEDRLEAALGGDAPGPWPTGAAVGRLRAAPDAERRYVSVLRATWPGSLDLAGVRLVLDLAHGATVRVGPRLFRSLGAEVTTLGARPSGTNINRGVGALHPEALQARVRDLPGAIGLAFDGDGDRLIAVDEDGAVRDGDHLLAIAAGALAARGELRGGAVVTTTMANVGLQRALAALGIETVRVQVGDRYVLEEMRRRGANLGGEQSGHLIFLDQGPTGDGLGSALQVLRRMRETGRPLRELASVVAKCPQVLVNVPVTAKPVLTDLASVGRAVARWERRFEGRARILLRYSGTEALARVMVEGDDQMVIEGAAQDIAAAIRAEIGRPA